MSSPGFLQIDTTINTAKAVSPSDGFAAFLLAMFWAGTFYTIGIIWTALALIDRWRGSDGTGRISFGSVIFAILLALPWPAVLILMALM